MADFHTTVLDNQIKALPTVDTASGSVATFDTDMTENLVEVKCQIVAQQGGSGTPSPSNPRPITVYTSLNLSHSGINSFDGNLIEGVLQGSDGAIIPSNDNFVSNSYIPVKSGTNIRWVCSKKTSTSQRFGYCFYDSNKNYILSSYMITGNPIISIPTGTSFMRFFVPKSWYGSTAEMDISINYPSTDTSYHAYNGTTANIPFGQTVANGVIDITTGKLTITDGVVEFDGSSDENWGTYATFNGFCFPRSDMKSGTNQEGLSNIFRVGVGWTSLGIRLGASNNYMYFVQIVNNISEVTDLASWKTYLSNNPVQVVYPLATPIEIQLDSITLQALLNENNIWCDTGDTEVKYLLTVGKKIA